MNPVREGIWNILSADSTLLGLATGGIHWREAPGGTQPPLCIYAKQAGTRFYTFAGPPMLSEVYTVKGVGFADDAEDIDLRCQYLLDNAVITVDDRILLLKPMAEEDIAYGEDVDGEHYEHVGTHYRVVTERAS